MFPKIITKNSCNFSSLQYISVVENAKPNLGENCALAANQSVDCRATILFTISLNSSKV